MDTSFDLNQWGYIKDILQKKFPELTHADLIWRHATKDELLKMISNKLGKTQKELMDAIESY